MASKMVKIFLVDGNALFISSVRMFLDMWPAAALVGHSDKAHIALALCAEVQPDLVLVDVANTSMDFAELVRKLKEQVGVPQVALLCMDSTEEYVQQARELGALGVISKSDFVLTLHHMVRALVAEVN